MLCKYIVRTRKFNHLKTHRATDPLCLRSYW